MVDLFFIQRNIVVLNVWETAWPFPVSMDVVDVFLNDITRFMKEPDYNAEARTLKGIVEGTTIQYRIVEFKPN